MSLSIEEIEAIGTIIPLLPPDAVIFDVGANTGTWSDMILENIPGSRIHFFEPNVELLNETKKKYEGNNNIVFSDLAVYKEDGADLPFFYFTNENNGLSSVYHNPKWDYLPMKRGIVKSITLDSYCRELGIEKIDCLKIDVEGAEYDVLLGCRDLLARKAAKYIQVEYSPHYKLTDRKFMDVVNYVRDFGYSAYFWQYGDFVKITEDNFVENYRLENFILTFEVLENITQHWNSEFIKNVRGRIGGCELVLEIGSFEGLTTRYICDHLLAPGGRVICVDPLKDEYLTEELSEEDIRMNKEYGFFNKQYYRFKKNTLSRPVELIRKTSKEAFPLLQDYRFDLIYIDGDHREESVYEDGVGAFEVCKIGGFILFDDYLWREGTTRGIDKFLEWAGGRVTMVVQEYQVMVIKIAE